MQLTRWIVAPLVMVSASVGMAEAASASAHQPARSAAHALTSGHSARTLAAIKPEGAAGSWHLVFNGLFDGTALDRSQWSTGWFGTGVTVPVQSHELECYSPSQVQVSGGDLLLSLHSEAVACGGVTRHYASGIVTTNGKFSFTYGFVQARIYLPPSGPRIADWPAFWADGQSWPNDGEMDILEGLGGLACYHFHSPSGGPGGCAPGNYTGWHTYGANWEPGSVTYYYDGNSVGSVRRGVTSAPMYLILNLAVDTSYGGAQVAPAQMKVQYVKVWQH